MSRRRVLVGSFAAVAAAIAVTGAAAFACITPASINLSTAAGRPGDVVTISGKSFSVPAGNPTGVQIYWAAPNGKLLAEATPTAEGTFETTFRVPDGPPGFYQVVAVLRAADGADVAGTPGRALFEVQNVQAAPAPAPEIQSFTPTADPSGSTFPLALVIGLGVVGLVLFTGGFVAVTRSRKAVAPAPSPVRED
ncbi:MAG: hypothetical protein ACRD2W_06930 [Acidimicrobiales bacterium]